MSSTSNLVSQLCLQISEISGEKVRPDDDITSFNLTSLEVLQIVLSTKSEKLAERLPCFFVPQTTIRSICTGIYEN